MQPTPLQRVYVRRLALLATYILIPTWVLAVVPQAPILGPFLLVSEAVRSFPILLLSSWIAVLAIAVLTWKTDPVRITTLLVCSGICSAVYTARIWPFLIPSPPQPTEMQAGATPIDIAVVNVEFGRASPQQLRKVLPERFPDILVISEATSDWINQAEFASEYQFKVEAPGNSAEGMAVFSHFPLEGATEIAPGFFKTFGISVQLTDNTNFHLVALHAPPPHVDPSFRSRETYFKLLDTYISSLPATDSVLLAGDFNTTPASDGYRTFASRHKLRNFAEGRGLPATWPLRLWPRVGAYIDQILYRGAVEVVDLRALQDFGSDHRPLFAAFRIPARQ